jgi:hypothetical protein
LSSEFANSTTRKHHELAVCPNALAYPFTAGWAPIGAPLLALARVLQSKDDSDVSAYSVP